MRLRTLAVAVLALSAAACGSTRLAVEAPPGALERVAAGARASGTWSVAEEAPGVVRLSRVHTLGSVAVMGSMRLGADLMQTGNILTGEFYGYTFGVLQPVPVRSPIGTPQDIPGRTMIAEILDWGGVADAARPMEFRRAGLPATIDPTDGTNTERTRP